VRRLLWLWIACGWLAAPVAGAPGIERTLRSEIRRLPAPAREERAGGGRDSTPSPRKAFLFSLLVPGLGQVYSSGWDPVSWTSARGLAYGVFEAVAWIEQQGNHGRGMDMQTKYRAFADANWHWSLNACTVLYNGEGAIDDDPFAPGYAGPDGVDIFIDTAADSLEFYEDIHKLQKWICGWDDYADERYFQTSSDETNRIWSTPMQLEYRAMRQRQNKLMSNADHWLWAIVANHVVSAFDAYFVAKGRARGDDLSALPAVRFGGTMTGDGASVAVAWSFR